MPEPPAELDQPEHCRPASARREVADWEYKTAYIPTFLVGIPARLHNRLCECQLPWSRAWMTRPPWSGISRQLTTS
jgi:hypothetical protein